METMIKNFKTGFTLAILITCVQAYAIYTYGSAITDGHPICKTYSQPDIYVAYQIKMGVYL